MLSTRKIARYGFKKQLGDFRDIPYVRRVTGTLPESVDLRDKLPECWDQGELGCCTGFGITGAVAFLHGYVGSQLWLYYQERVIEGSVNEDSGAQIRDGFKVITTLGLPKLEEWPYDISKFTQQPPAAVTANAPQECTVIQYQSLDHSSFSMAQRMANYKDCLAAGYPFVFGFTVYSSFESQHVADNGIVPEPGIFDQVLGGHCVLCVGYKTINGKLYFVCRNSWGPEWGDNGYFYLPEIFFTNADLASDMWVALADVEGGKPAPTPPQPTASYVVFGKSKVYHSPKHYPHKTNGVTITDTTGHRPCKICIH